MQKTLLISNSLYDMVRVRWLQTESLLSFDEYLLDSIASARHQISTGLKPSPQQRNYDLDGFQIVEIETDTDWLLDATTDEINSLLYVSIQTGVPHYVTGSPTVVFLTKLAKLLKLSPNDTANKTNLGYWYAKLLKSSLVTKIASFSITSEAIRQIEWRIRKQAILKIVTSVFMILALYQLSLSVPSQTIHSIKTGYEFNIVAILIIAVVIPLAIVISMFLQYTLRSLKIFFMLAQTVLAGCAVWAMTHGYMGHNVTSEMIKNLLLVNTIIGYVELALLLSAFLSIGLAVRDINNASLLTNKQLIHEPISQIIIYSIKVQANEEDEVVSSSLHIIKPKLVLSSGNNFHVAFDNVMVTATRLSTKPLTDR